MILIADSGSTKTAWVAISEGGKIHHRATTAGINPFFISQADIASDIASNVAPEFAGFTISDIHFYGAGCAFVDKNVMVAEALAESFSEAKISIDSDMVGAALGLCGRRPGIAAILGTGSNTCYWDGEKIAKNVSPLGFILGDEGSGAVLGKNFIADVMKNQIDHTIGEKFFAQMELTPAEIINRVYRQPFPNRFLASFTRFMNENKQHPDVEAIITRSFRAFFERNIMQYDYRTLDVNVIGSIGFYFREMLLAAAEPLGIRLGKIEQSPMEGLIEFHTKNSRYGI